MRRDLSLPRASLVAEPIAHVAPSPSNSKRPEFVPSACCPRLSNHVVQNLACVGKGARGFLKLFPGTSRNANACHQEQDCQNEPCPPQRAAAARPPHAFQMRTNWLAKPIDHRARPI